jgi:hypothetical protein
LLPLEQSWCPEIDVLLLDDGVANCELEERAAAEQAEQEEEEKEARERKAKQDQEQRARAAAAEAESKRKEKEMCEREERASCEEREDDEGAGGSSARETDSEGCRKGGSFAQDLDRWSQVLWETYAPLCPLVTGLSAVYHYAPVWLSLLLEGDLCSRLLASDEGSKPYRERETDLIDLQSKR